jgi:short-subunit dehydrogenase
MRIFITGSSSGIGQSLYNLLKHDHIVIAPHRNELDLSSSAQCINYIHDPVDILINCAGTGVGGKIEFAMHQPNSVLDILLINLVSPVLLTQSALKHNPTCKIINITSTNNIRYYPNDLVYSLSKQSLADFGDMLRTEYPNVPYLEVRVGLTQTNFNQNRYQQEPDRYVDIYDRKCLTSDQVAVKIVEVLFDNSIKFIEISP